MKKVILNIFLGSLVVLLAGLVAIGVLLKNINPNDYQEDIIAVVYEKTGQTLIFDGELQTTVFPVLGLKTGRIRIADEAIYGSGPFAQVDHTTFKVAIMPLLEKKVEIEEILLDGLTVKLAVASNGKKNWEYNKNSEEEQKLRQADGVTALSAPEGMAQQKPVPVKKSNFAVHVAKVRCTNMAIRYVDLGLGAAYKVVIDSLATEDLAVESRFPLVFTGMVQDEVHGMEADFALNALAFFAADGSFQVTLEKLALIAGEKAQGSQLSKGVDIQLAGEIAYDAPTKTYTFEKLQGVAGKASFDGQLALQRIIPENFLSGVEFTLNGTFKVNGSLDVDELLASLFVAKPAKRELIGGVEGAVVIDTHGKILEAPEKKKKKTSATFFQRFNGTVGISAESVIVKHIPFTAINADVTLSEKGLAIPRFSCQAFDGDINGSAFMEPQEGKAQYRLRGKAEGLSAEAVLKEFGVSSVKGVLGLDANITTVGSEHESLLKNASGQASFLLTHGESFKSPFFARILPEVKHLPQLFTVERLSGSFAVAKGFATTKNLQLRSPVVHGDAAGGIDLVRQRLDMNGSLLFEGRPPAINISVTGEIRNPLVRVEPVSLIQGIVHRVENLDGKKLGKDLEKGAKKLLREGGLEKLLEKKKK